MGIEVRMELLDTGRVKVTSFKSKAKMYIDLHKKTSLSPTLNPSELFLASIGGCVMYYAHTYLSNSGIKFNKLEIEVKGEWEKTPLLMIKNLRLIIFTDVELKDKKEAFLRFVHNCPVHNTIINTQKVDIDVQSSS